MWNFSTYSGSCDICSWLYQGVHIRALFAWPLIVSVKIFLRSWGWSTPFIWLWFQLIFDVRNLLAMFHQKQRKALPLTTNLCFSNVALSKQIYFCGKVRQWGIHLTKILFATIHVLQLEYGCFWKLCRFCSLLHMFSSLLLYSLT